ncbi:hypothetical protein COCOBI_16-0310 [Coccomyxa sp. Obi]|nr:hypothetical protein COCOBI_16-0310 [Coccomyxa sp. Obi]
MQVTESYVRCQATWEFLPYDAVVAGYLFDPEDQMGWGFEWGLTDLGNDFRNALVWYEGVHKAWRQCRICLENVGDQLRFRVLDRTLLDVCPVDLAAPENRGLATDALRAMTFRQLDKQEIYFPAHVKTRPYPRIIATQAANAITKMWKMGRLREDIEKFRLDVVEDFPAKQACLWWIRTMMVHIPDWPVGPEPEV